MKFFAVAALSAIVSLAAATPFGPPQRPPPPPPPIPQRPTTTTTKPAAPTYPASTGSPAGSNPHSTSAALTTTTTYAPTTTWVPTTSTTTTTTSTSTTPYQGTVTCLNDASASYLVNGFASLLTAFNNDTAEAILASDFSDWSDSINWLAGGTLGAVTIASKLAFEESQEKLPAIGFNILAIDAVACKVIAYRWAALLGGSPIQGINIIYASNLNGTNEGWQIEKNFSEFNSGLWLEELGGTFPPPGS